MANLDRAKLVKLLGMLGSSHDGETLQAARKAQQMVTNSGLSWQDVVALSETDSDVKDTILSIDESLRRLPDHDKKAFLEMRDRYFSGTLSETDRRRLTYFFDLYIHRRDQEIPF